MNGNAPCRVAVTRDEKGDGALAQALRSEGLLPVACQSVRVVPPPVPDLLQAAARSLAKRDWLVVASRRSVLAILDARGGRQLPVTLRSAAVGESTAAALRSAGAQHVICAEEPGAHGLLALLQGADYWQGREVLAPRAAEGSRLIAETLRGWGARVEEIVAYSTVPRSPREITRKWRAASPVAAVITSPSAAEALVNAVGAGSLRSLEVVVAIGPTTAGALAHLGVPALISPRADFSSVAQHTRRALQETAWQRSVRSDPAPGSYSRRARQPIPS
jgi:uroporphyrinogen-III synthase